NINAEFYISRVSKDNIITNINIKKIIEQKYIIPKEQDDQDVLTKTSIFSNTITWPRLKIYLQ
ncbi:hypothetical protein CUMW_154860, partial [Citrus unshiu]